MRGYFVVSIVHQTLTRTTGYLACVRDLFAWGYTLVCRLIQRTLMESAQNLTPEKSQGGRKASHVTVTHSFGDHARLCLTIAFKNECPCSAPLTLLALCVFTSVSLCTWVYRGWWQHSNWEYVIIYWKNITIYLLWKLITHWFSSLKRRRSNNSNKMNPHIVCHFHLDTRT